MEPFLPLKGGTFSTRLFRPQVVHFDRPLTLDRELYIRMQEVNRSLEDWRYQYNYKRPHGSLGNVAPAVAAKA
jgi:transposase InsO family protein